VVEHRFVEGWKLEALDRSLPSVIRPATVVRVINKLFFIIEFDDLTTTTSDERTPGNHLCCHAGSLNIFPVGWCSANSVHLTPVPGQFSWPVFFLLTFVVLWCYDKVVFNLKRFCIPVNGTPSHSSYCGASLAMGSHSVTFHPTQVNTRRLHPSQTGQYSIPEVWKAELAEH